MALGEHRTRRRAGAALAPPRCAQRDARLPPWAPRAPNARLQVAGLGGGGGAIRSPHHPAWAWPSRAIKGAATPWPPRFHDRFGCCCCGSNPGELRRLGAPGARHSVSRERQQSTENRTEIVAAKRKPALFRGGGAAPRGKGEEDSNITGRLTHSRVAQNQHPLCRRVS
jgi:hypothetical protein